jgi:hypothetical protein
MAAPRVSAFMGRKRIAAGLAHGESQAALSAQFQSTLEDLLQGFREFVDELDGASADMLVEALEPTFGKSLEMCPVKNGDLRQSGYLEARSYYRRAEAEIGYGRGGNPDYAIYVHEMPYAHEPPTQSKFLQQALEEDYFTILNSLPRIVREFAGT